MPYIYISKHNIQDRRDRDGHNLQLVVIACNEKVSVSLKRNLDERNTRFMYISWFVIIIQKAWARRYICIHTMMWCAAR